MGLKGRIDRLEIEAQEVELRRYAEELAAEYGIDVDQLVEETRRTDARLRMLKLMYPSAAVKDDEDMEPYLRMLAEEEGLDPDEVMKRRGASRKGAMPLGKREPNNPPVRMHHPHIVYGTEKGARPLAQRLTFYLDQFSPGGGGRSISNGAGVLIVTLLADDRGADRKAKYIICIDI